LEGKVLKEEGNIEKKENNSRVRKITVRDTRKEVSY
jgi:hypothetical protein